MTTSPNRSELEPRPALQLGRYPTPVVRVAALSRPGCDLWVKRDDLTHEVYGGNKVRKLEHLLAEAIARRVTRVVTIGAVGSHHVLATTYFGGQAGLAVEAVLVPQPSTPHVLEVLRADLGLGLKVFPVRSWWAVPFVFGARVAAGAWPIPVGGSNLTGSMGYVQAARELAVQVREGLLPEPDVCVVALGSGGTAAGLAAGFAAEGLRTRVVGACVSAPPWALRVASLSLAKACARRAGPPGIAASMAARLTIDTRFLGEGYGHASPRAEEAAAEALQEIGLTLDPTYTAKAFASALWHVRARQGKSVLYWHTLSSAPMAPLLSSAPALRDVDPSLRRLAIAPSPALP
ncbi:MAG TPA: pyridoxal-phosphate dependent enzyme [Polyangiaceae bacterium]|nr:pyridoxal-phosphate dependent enzyme [Polyangiaceae bacterium]